MCFSATSSFLIATSLLVSSVIALQKATDKRMIPLCLIPFGFALQQAAEGIVWLTIDKPDSWQHQFGMYTFLSCAFIVWPLWMPFAVKLYEQNYTKKILLTLCQLIGLLFAITAAFFLAICAPTVSVETGNIAYQFQHTFFGERSGLAWYIIPTLLPFLLECNRIIGNLFVTFAVISLTATYLVLPAALISVWCFMAAVISLMVIGLLYQDRHPKKEL